MQQNSIASFPKELNLYFSIALKLPLRIPFKDADTPNNSQYLPVPIFPPLIYPNPPLLLVLIHFLHSFDLWSASSTRFPNLIHTPSLYSSLAFSPHIHTISMYYASFSQTPFNQHHLLSNPNHISHTHSCCYHCHLLSGHTLL